MELLVILLLFDFTQWNCILKFLQNLWTLSHPYSPKTSCGGPVMFLTCFPLPWLSVLAGITSCCTMRISCLDSGLRDVSLWSLHDLPVLFSLSEDTHIIMGVFTIVCLCCCFATLCLLFEVSCSNVFKTHLFSYMHYIQWLKGKFAHVWCRWRLWACIFLISSAHIWPWFGGKGARWH